MKNNLSILILMMLPLWGIQAENTMTNKPVWLDPVVLENSRLKLVIDRGRGATLRSLIDKASGAETAREFLTSGGWAGALAEDRLAGDGYPGDITRLKYAGEIESDSKGARLRLTCRPTEEKYQGLEFVKTFTLHDASSFVIVDLPASTVAER